MSMTNESALVWLGDEVQATLTELHADLERLAGTTSSEEIESLLARCESKTHSVSGAFEVVGCKPLSRYVLALQNVIRLWRATPSLMEPQSLAQSLLASHRLHDFLQVIKEKKAYAELSLYDSYRELGKILSQSFHPIDLWHSTDCTASLKAWSEKLAIQELYQQALQRLSRIRSNEVPYGDVDTLMLALIRHNKPEAAASLQSICDSQIVKTDDNSTQILRGSLLAVVVQALSHNYLILDVYLKRFLLSQMAWLKGQEVSEDSHFLNEATFFTYIAWQEQLTSKGVGGVGAEKNETQLELDRLAHWAQWQPLKGTNYSHPFFGQHSREQILAAQEAVTLTRQVWNDFCSNETIHVAKINEIELVTSFDKMAACLNLLHPVANILSHAFHQIICETHLRAKREVQIEIATSLLTLGEVLNDIKGIGEAEIEQRLVDLIRRLNCVHNEQDPGAFDPWMLDLQLRQNWADAMSISIHQLENKLSEIASIFEHAWRHPDETLELLSPVPEKLRQIGDVALSLQLHNFVLAIRAIEDKVQTFLQNDQSMDLTLQKQIAADFGALGLMLSMWAHKPEQAMTALSLAATSTPQEDEEEEDDGSPELTNAAERALDGPTVDLPPSDWLDLVDEDQQMKTIGDISISIPLYNAYLSETDEWSRQLALALSEWSLDNNQPIPSQTLTWAHALAGSSATIGFTACSDLAKSIERLIEKIQEQELHSADLAQTLSHAADEVRRLLHQFAAGFLKIPDPVLLAEINHYLQEPAVDAAKNPHIQSDALVTPEISDVPEAPNALDRHLDVSSASNHTIMSADGEMLAVFQEESAQLMPELGLALRAWAQSPDQFDYRTQALRILHTLKGSARLVGETTLAHQAHELESQIEQLQSMPDAQSLSKLLASYDQLSGKPAASVSEPTLPLTSHTQFLAIAPAGETIRVQSSTIDRLVNQTGEVMIARSRMEAEMSRSLRTLTDLGSQVQRLREQLRELELQTESQMQSRQANVIDLANSFDPLELDRFTRTQELTRFMAEALSDVSTLQRNLQRSLNATEDDLAAQLRQTRDLQRHLLRTRMVEFDSISERLHRLVRVTSQELDKSVELIIQNGGQEMDRSVLERMVPAFEHLLRNAVVHGIESPSVRAAKGKNDQGKIQLHLTQQSNDVIIALHDDGQGIDEEAIQLKAHQLPQATSASTDVRDLIFMPGLSTAGQVSELAGRGIGLDAVRAQVQALGGRIEVDFTKDAGTTFKLILPLTTAVTQIVLVRTGTVMTGIPGNLVLNVLRVKVDDVTEAQLTGQFTSGGQSFPFYKFNHLLQYKTQPLETEQATQSVMLLQSAGQVVAVHVDEVIGNQEVMVKNLGVQLGQMPGLSGMTVLPTGSTVLIYNPVALAAVYGARLTSWQNTHHTHPSTDLEGVISWGSADEAEQSPLVLVVDDSITMRRVLQRLLLREGYRVSLAADGRQALDMLRLEKPILVLSDVEMPRMDGFELLRNIRESDRLKDVPVVMITSRIADKHREHAKSLGANEYLGKPYSEEELLQVLKRYAHAGTVEA